MTVTPMEIEILGKNEEYLGNMMLEDKTSYILRKRRADLISVVQKVLENELDEREKCVLLSMMLDNVPARTLSQQMNAPIAMIYRIRNRAEKKLSDFLKYVLFYTDVLEGRMTAPIEMRNALALARTKTVACRSVVHRLKKLMAQEGIGVEGLYNTPGLNKKSVDEIFCHGRMPDVNEIVALSNFFGTTSDYLLKGENSCTGH